VLTTVTAGQQGEVTLLLPVVQFFFAFFTVVVPGFLCVTARTARRHRVLRNHTCVERSAANPLQPLKDTFTLENIFLLCFFLPTHAAPPHFKTKEKRQWRGCVAHRTGDTATHVCIK
jgi:hypothetical protein